MPYLDHAATAGMSDAALAAYVAAAEVVGNPSSLHSAGRAARNIVEDARESIAANLGAHPTEVVFTSGGTESNNLAVKGIYWAQVERDPQRRGLLVSAIEHHSILEPARWLARHGAHLNLIPVTRDGVVTPDALTSAVEPVETKGVPTPRGFVTPLRGSSTDGSAGPPRDVILRPREAGNAESLGAEAGRPRSGVAAAVETPSSSGLTPMVSTSSTAGVSAHALVSVMLASNEIGTIQPVAELAELAHRHQIPFHTDAVAALGQIPVSFSELGVDAMSVAAHKIGGPLGVGALIARRDLRIEPLLHGGEQERGLRSGTVDVPGVAAFAAALAETTANLDRFQSRTSQIRDQLINGVLTTIPNAILSGSKNARLPANASFVFPGADPDALLFGLDNAGFAASIGAACAAGVARPSEALIACGFSVGEAKSSLRFTLGPTTSSEDVVQLLEVLPGVVAAARM